MREQTARAKALKEMHRATADMFEVMVKYIPIGPAVREGVTARQLFSDGVYALRDAAIKAGRETERWVHARHPSTPPQPKDTRGGGT